MYDDLSKKLKDTINNDKYSFQSSMKNSVTSIIDTQIAPWLEKCFQKYPPDEFHKRMHGKYEFDGFIYEGFDYMSDWRIHHRKMFIAFKMARRMKKYLNLDGTKLYITITNLLESKGYRLQEHEKTCISHTIAKVLREIYT